MGRKKQKGGNSNQFNMTLGAGDSAGGALDQANQNQANVALAATKMQQQGGAPQTELMPPPAMTGDQGGVLAGAANTAQQATADSQFDNQVGKPSACQKSLSGMGGGKRRRRRKSFRKKRKTKKRKSKRKKSKRRRKRKTKRRSKRRKTMRNIRFSHMPPLKV